MSRGIRLGLPLICLLLAACGYFGWRQGRMRALRERVAWAQMEAVRLQPVFQRSEELTQRRDELRAVVERLHGEPIAAPPLARLTLAPQAPPEPGAIATDADFAAHRMALEAMTTHVQRGVALGKGLPELEREIADIQAFLRASRPERSERPDRPERRVRPERPGL